MRSTNAPSSLEDPALTHLVEVTVPPRAMERSSLLEVEGLAIGEAKGVIHGVGQGRQAVALPHRFGDVEIEIDDLASHAPRVRRRRSCPTSMRW